MIIKDFAAHNAEIKEMWQAYHAGQPYRVPLTLGISQRFYLLNPVLNPDRVSFRDYTLNPEVMLSCQLRNAHWAAFHLAMDAPRGLPEEGWSVNVDFQNYYEAAFLGAEVIFREGQVPDTIPPLRGEDGPRRIDTLPWHDFMNGEWMERNFRTWRHFQDQMRAGREFAGRPIASAGLSGLGTDGPWTVATNLRGVELYSDLYERPEFVRDLLDRITEATIRRVRILRRIANQKPGPGYGYADDSIQLLSTKHVREFVIPYHRRLIEALETPGERRIHLCGDATRHFPLLKQELHITSFDTGFPVDFRWLRETLGDDVEILGGPSIMLLQHGNAAQIRARTREILTETGVTRGGRFIIREGNNLAPGTSEENVDAFYAAAREFGRLRTA
mgnify:CR=1 FL=1